MQKLLMLLVVLALLAPHAGAKGEPDFPADIKKLTGEWIAEARADAAGHEDRTWYPGAVKFLDTAEDALAKGRVRVAMFGLETFYELFETGKLMDDSAELGNDADRRQLVTQRTNGWSEQALADWATLRKDTHALDGKLRSLQSTERALYAADLGLAARIGLNAYTHLAKEYPKQQGFQEAYVMALVSASHTPNLNLKWASDILDTVGSLEGLEPALNTTAWKAIADAALVPQAAENTPPALKAYEDLAKPIRENGEGLVATALYLAELRAARENAIYIIYGDAQSRNQDVVNDSARNMGKRVANASVQEARDVGLQGIFTSDALDRAAYTIEFAERGQATLGIVVGSWAGVDHAGYVVSTLATASPIQPPAVQAEDTKKGTPFPTTLVVLGVGLVALALRRKA